MWYGINFFLNTLRIVSYHIISDVRIFEREILKLLKFNYNIIMVLKSYSYIYILLLKIL